MADFNNPLLQMGLGILSNNTGHYGATMPALSGGISQGLLAVQKGKEKAYADELKAIQMMQLKTQMAQQKAQQGRLSAVRDNNPNNDYAQLDPKGWLSSQAALAAAQAKTAGNRQWDLWLEQNKNKWGADAKADEQRRAFNYQQYGTAYAPGEGQTAPVGNFTPYNPQQTQPDLSGVPFNERGKLQAKIVQNDIDRENDKLKEQDKAALDLPKYEQSVNDSIKKIDELIGDEAGLVKPHPGFESAVGWNAHLPTINGTDASDFKNRLDQLKGKVFMEAYQGLKGGGSITEVETSKATQALARMNVSTSEKEFIAAARDFQAALKSGLELMKKKAGAVNSEIKFLGFE